MKAGIIGSGIVAKVLAAGFAKHGHDVVLGTRDPSKLTEWTSKNPTVRIDSFAVAAAHGEVVVLAVKGLVALEALQLAGAANLRGKIIMDATNPLAESEPDHGVLKYFVGLDESLMERLQHAFPDAFFVKAFNSVGNARMINPKFHDGRPTMFICGDSDHAKAVVEDILDQFGWDTADMGSVEAARAIEPLCMLWCIPGLLHNEWTHAFKLLRR